MYGLGCPSRDGRHDEQLPCLKGSGTLKFAKQAYGAVGGGCIRIQF